MSGVAHTQNHVIPDRMKHISNNNKQYKQIQNNLKQQYQDENHVENLNKNINFNNLIQDFHSNNIVFAKSKQEQDEIFRQESQQYAHQPPNMNAVDMEIDEGF